MKNEHTVIPYIANAGTCDDAVRCEEVDGGEIPMYFHKFPDIHHDFLILLLVHHSHPKFLPRSAEGYFVLHN